MSPDWFTDVRPLVKDGTRSVIQRHEDAEIDAATMTFYRLNSTGFMDNTEEFTVDVPENVFEDQDVFDNLYEGEFTEAALNIYEHVPDPPEDDFYPEEKRIEDIERGLFAFVGIVLKYAGHWEFNEDAFDAAYDEQFEPRFSDREYSRFLLCLKNTTIEPDTTIDLETGLQGSPDYLGPYEIDSLRIRPLDGLEETGIASHEAPGTGVLEQVESLDARRSNPALEIVLHRLRPYREIAAEIDEININPWKEPDFEITPVDVYPWQQLIDVVEYIAIGIRRCLRLLSPRGTVGFSKGYHVVPGWETYRGISAPVTFEFEFDCPSATVGNHIAGDSAGEIQQYWEKHRDQLSIDNSMFQNPLSRFEMMFSRESLEDKLVDCVVGCETTLLKDGKRGGNRYRLGVRAAVLFGNRDSQDWSPERMAEFFRTLYEWRNEVVHRDVALPNEPNADQLISVSDRSYLASDFLIQAREFYADTIREYHKINRTENKSIDTINERIDACTLQQGTKIRNQLF